MISLYIFRN
uniref:Uncharacterized protein n=1 Tax=Anguilla anguilla TaxID=7936 RepID=A0A0E9PUP6_ANGAN